MLSYLDYPFFRYAMAASLLLSICAGLIGTYIVARRLTSIAGGVTHACFGGLGLGYFLGINPIVTAALFAIGSSVGVQWMSGRFNLREDSAIAVVWALGMAVGTMFVFLTPGYVPELNAFLFGNIMTVSAADLQAFAIFTVVLAAFFALLRRRIVAVAFDADFASVIGLPVRFISYAMTVLVAVCIVLTIRLVGIMLLMSMLSLPVMTAEIFTHRFAPLALWSALVAALCSLGGLALSTVIDVPCSALIVLFLAAVFIVARLAAALVRR